MLTVDKLSCRVKSKLGRITNFTLDNISFELEDGYIMSLIGKNGAGKSTLLRLLYGVMKADEGSIKWNNHKINSVQNNFRNQVAYVGDEGLFLEEETINFNVEFFENLYEQFDINLFNEYCDKFELSKNIGEQIYSSLSTGQKKQVEIAFSLARKPKLILLDEPMANMDPIFRIDFMTLLQKLVEKEEISIIISTHIFDEIEDIFDYAGVLQNGEMVLFGDREEVLKEKKTIAELLVEGEA